jgi:hypothetical protein
MTAPIVRAMTPADWRGVADTCGAGTSTGNAAFETEPPTWRRGAEPSRPVAVKRPLR